MDAQNAKLVCECQFLGLEREGMTPDVHPDVVGVGIGHRTVRGFPTEGLALKVYVRQKIHHVLVKENRGVEGDPILQPGAFDGGKPDRDVIGRLDTYVAVDPEGPNLADAAIAAPFDVHDVTPDILNIGRLRGTREPTLDEKVMKSGRTTRLTSGTVVDASATLRVGYSTGAYVFTDQMIIKGERGSFSAGGDSGSTIVAYDGRAVGLLFAGSPFFTVANKMPNVEKALDVKVI